jgi:hypothetical protein
MALSPVQFTRLLATGILVSLWACTSPGPTPAVKPFLPALSLRPIGVLLAPGATQIFQAELNLPEGVHDQKQLVGWRVLEPGGGTLSNTGLYTAPATPGVYHVQVCRVDFPGVTAIATVTVK